AYVRFKSIHLCGFADPWVTHRSSIATKALPLLKRLHMLAICYYKRLRLSPDDFYWLEAEVARQGLIKLIHVAPSRVRVIPNTYADVFSQKNSTLYPRRHDETTRIFCIAAPYPHKNLPIVPHVAHLLREKDGHNKFRFIVTLPETGDEVNRFWKIAQNLNVLDMIENIGTITLSDCPKWYASADMVFLPTLLETFSATYPEAMVMEKPIVTTDLDFARDICGDAAVYYSPLSAQEAAESIQKVSTDQAFREDLIQRGKDRLKQFPDPHEKFNLMMNWIEEIAEAA
ncbi:MAG: glycosyltransferase, partial [Desulfobacteraceae bacterium]